jgi:hypothetical protein
MCRSCNKNSNKIASLEKDIDELNEEMIDLECAYALLQTRYIVLKTKYTNKKTKCAILKQRISRIKKYSKLLIDGFLHTKEVIEEIDSIADDDF